MLEHWIWLSTIFETGCNKTDVLLKHFGSIEAVFNADVSELKRVNGINSVDVAALCNKSLDKSGKIISRCMELKYKILTPDSAYFPKSLLGIYSCPCALYVWGEMPDTTEEVLISIVGTRDITIYGHDIAMKLSIGLAQSGVIIVSGLALGVDSVAHKGALKGGGKTIAVVGCGLDYNYPAKNEDLKRIISKNGAVISEYPPGVPPLKYHFPVRNRIISGLSLATIVVEAGEKSGSLITASIAIEQGKDVYAVPGNISSLMSAGPNRLIREGAKPINNFNDVIGDYLPKYPHILKLNGIEKGNLDKNSIRFHENNNIEKPNVEKVAVCAKLFVPPSYLSPLQLQIFDALQEMPMKIEELSIKTSIATHKTAAALTALEIQDLITLEPNGKYRLVGR